MLLPTIFWRNPENSLLYPYVYSTKPLNRMYESATRELTPEEIESLKEARTKAKAGRRFTWQRGLILALSFFSFPYIINMMRVRFLGEWINLVGFGLFLACIIVFFSALFGYLRKVITTWRGLYDFDWCIKQNEVQVDRFQSSEVIELEKFKGYGRHFLFQVEENTVGSVFGTYLYDQPQMPNADFEILTDNGRKGPILKRVECYGDQLEVYKTISEKEQNKLWD